jgi:choline dehydrogenase-like flavoprotein
MKGTFRAGAPIDIDCNTVIVGSGAGGSCVADVFIRAGIDVVMLEEGPYLPAKGAPACATAAFPRAWRNGGLTLALGKPPIAYAEGCCVGGGTEINSAIFQRTPDELLDAWGKRDSIDSFGADALRPFFDRAAAAVNASLTPEPLGMASEIIKTGAERLGWSVCALERGQRCCVGTNLCSFICPTGAKQSMSVTLLPGAIARGMRLIANCRVNRIQVRSGRAVGVAATAIDADGMRHRVHVRAQNVVLAAGATQTPALLQRSGFKGRIGTVLRLHPTVKAIGFFDMPVDAHLSRLPLYAVTEFMPDRRIGGSLFSPAIYAMSLAEDWHNRSHLVGRWRHAGIYYGMIRPRGTGRVRAMPVGGDTLVTYDLTDEDWGGLAGILRAVCQVLFAAGARFVMPSIFGHQGWHTVDDLRDNLQDAFRRKQVNLMSIHLFSSCPPGENRHLSVTDSFGRIRGLSNVLIADASQIPDAPGVNPQATVMALAYRAGEAWLAMNERERARRVTREE